MLVFSNVQAEKSYTANFQRACVKYDVFDRGSAILMYVIAAQRLRVKGMFGLTLTLCWIRIAILAMELLFIRVFDEYFIDPSSDSWLELVKTAILCNKWPMLFISAIGQPMRLDRHVPVQLVATFISLCSNVRTCQIMLAWPKAHKTFSMISRAALAWQAPLDELLPSGLPPSLSLTPTAACWASTALLQLLLGLALPTIILARQELRDRYKFAQARGLAYAVTLQQVLWSCSLQYAPLLLVGLVYSSLHCFVSGGL